MTAPASTANPLAAQATNPSIVSKSFEPFCHAPGLQSASYRFIMSVTTQQPLIVPRQRGPWACMRSQRRNIPQQRSPLKQGNRNATICFPNQTHDLQGVPESLLKTKEHRRRVTIISQPYLACPGRVPLLRTSVPILVLTTVPTLPTRYSLYSSTIVP